MSNPNSPNGGGPPYPGAQPGQDPQAAPHGPPAYGYPQQGYPMQPGYPPGPPMAQGYPPQGYPQGYPPPQGYPQGYPPPQGYPMHPGYPSPHGAPINIVVQNAATMGVGAGGLVRVGNKSRLTAALICFFLGGLGAHKFYLGQTGMGLVYLFFSWTLIPGFIAFIEFILLLIQSDREFDLKYNAALAR